MKTACLALSTLLLCACATSEPAVPLEAPHVQFKTAVVIAAVRPADRAAVEDLVTAELRRRRPGTKIIASHKPFPELMGVSRKRFEGYLATQQVDVVLTIVPFAEVISANFDEWADVADDELTNFLGGMEPHAIIGNFGVQLVAWDSKTWEPLYARTSELLVGQITGPEGVAEFAVASISRSTD